MAKHKNNQAVSFQELVDQNVSAWVLATALVVSVGGIFDIVPLLSLDSTLLFR